MISISRESLCMSCVHHPRVKQDDHTEATERMVCDKYDPVPRRVMRLNDNCPEYQDSGEKRFC